MLAGVVLIGFVLMTAEEGGDQVDAGNGSPVVTGDGASATVNNGIQTNGSGGSTVTATGNARPVTATNGAAAGGDMSGNTITITNGD